jgi:hypothetical protein
MGDPFKKDRDAAEVFGDSIEQGNLKGALDALRGKQPAPAPHDTSPGDDSGGGDGNDGDITININQ